MSTTHRHLQQTSLPSELAPIDSTTAPDRYIEYLAIPLTLFSSTLNITIILNIVYCLLYCLGIILLSIAVVLTASENITGFIVVIYCTAFLGLVCVTSFDIIGEAMGKSDGLALERPSEAEEPVANVVEAIIEPALETVIEPVLEAIGVRPRRRRHTYSNLTC